MEGAGFLMLETGDTRPRRMLSKLGEAMVRLGMLSCGLAVVATASLLAWHLH